MAASNSKSCDTNSRNIWMHSSRTVKLPLLSGEESCSLFTLEPGPGINSSSSLSSSGWMEIDRSLKYIWAREQIVSAGGPSCWVSVCRFGTTVTSSTAASPCSGDSLWRSSGTLMEFFFLPLHVYQKFEFVKGSNVNVLHKADHKTFSSKMAYVVPIFPHFEYLKNSKWKIQQSPWNEWNICKKL